MQPKNRVRNRKLVTGLGGFAGANYDLCSGCNYGMDTSSLVE